MCNRYICNIGRTTILLMVAALILLCVSCNRQGNSPTTFTSGQYKVHRSWVGTRHYEEEWSSEQKNSGRVIKTKEELTSFYQEYLMPHVQTAAYNECLPVSETCDAIVASYNEDWFDDHLLINLFLHADTGTKIKEQRPQPADVPDYAAEYHYPLWDVAVPQISYANGTIWSELYMPYEENWEERASKLTYLGFDDKLHTVLQFFVVFIEFEKKDVPDEWLSGEVEIQFDFLNAPNGDIVPGWYEPTVTAPEETDPPVTDPPTTTAPPETDPPVTDPPVTDPPVTEPPIPYTEYEIPYGTDGSNVQLEDWWNLGTRKTSTHYYAFRDYAQFEKERDRWYSDFYEEVLIDVCLSLEQHLSSFSEAWFEDRILFVIWNYNMVPMNAPEQVPPVYVKNPKSLGVYEGQLYLILQSEEQSFRPSALMAHVTTFSLDEEDLVRMGVTKNDVKLIVDGQLTDISLPIG